jgi:putative ABC transport system substrate-binding protein
MTTRGLQRRRFLAGLGLVAGGVAWAGLLGACERLAALPSSKRIARVGYLDSGAQGASSQPTDALLAGLRDNGWVDGDTLRLEHRYENGDEGHLLDLARELISLPVDVLVATSTQGARAAKQLGSNVPIVFTGLQDPVGAGLIDNLARPGGSLTGTTLMTPQLHGKRLELLKATVPELKRVAVLGNPTSAGLNMPDIEAAAHPLDLAPLPFEAHSTADLQDAFDRIARSGAQALMVLPDALFFNNRPVVIGGVARLGIADMYWAREFAAEGRLMAYGGNRTDAFRRAATYVDKILRGAQPADLPVEQPVQFDFAINLRTAADLGLSVPTALLSQATEVIPAAP